MFRQNVVYMLGDTAIYMLVYVNTNINSHLSIYLYIYIYIRIIIDGVVFKGKNAKQAAEKRRMTVTNRPQSRRKLPF